MANLLNYLKPDERKGKRQHSETKQKFPCRKKSTQQTNVLIKQLRYLYHFDI